MAGYSTVLRLWICARIATRCTGLISDSSINLENICAALVEQQGPGPAKVNRRDPKSIGVALGDADFRTLATAMLIDSMDSLKHFRPNEIEYVHPVPNWCAA